MQVVGQPVGAYDQEVTAHFRYVGAQLVACRGQIGGQGVYAASKRQQHRHQHEQHTLRIVW